VKLQRLRAAVFGPHRDRDLDLEADFVVVFGRNESGKSCFRAAVETVLYGYDPAKRETHPLYLWDENPGGDLHIEADLAMDDGSVLRVERVLQAVGKSRTAKAGEAFEGARQGNTPLAFVDGLPRQLFQSIYSVEIEQLTALQDGVQKHVDDLLLPEAQSLRLRPIARIRASLSDDHEKLWRPDNRGKPHAGALAKELSSARKRVGVVIREEQELREALAEQEKLIEKLAEDRAKKNRLERAKGDAPYLNELFALFQRKRRVGTAVDLSALGERQLVDPAALRRSLDKLEAEFAKPRQRLAQEPLALGEREQAVLDAAGDIRVALEQAREQAADKKHCAEFAGNAQSLRDDATESLTGALTRGADGGDLDGVAALPLEQLRSAQARWARELEQHVTAPAPGHAPRWSLVLAGAGFLVAIVAAFNELGPWPVALGALATFAGTIAAFAGRSGPRDSDRQPVIRPLAIAEILEGLPVAPTFLGSPTELLRLIGVLGNTQRHLRDAGKAEGRAEGLRLEIRQRESNWRSLCERLGLDADGDGAHLIERLRNALDSAKEDEKKVEGDASERGNAESAIAAAKPAINQQKAHLADVKRTLEQAESEATSLDDAYQRVSARLQDQHFAAERERALRSDPRWERYCDDPRVTAEHAPDDADWLEDVSAERDRVLHEVGDAIENANKRLGELNVLLEKDAGSRSAIARDAVCSLEEELAETKRRRDALALLDSILARAEHEFREEHQPDVLRRASSYLSRVTRGRYHRLYYLEGEDGGLHVACEDHSEPLPVAAPISRGTLDQIFLCLRLGLLDHLDRNREKLPLILDDALLRMDDERRPEVYRLLADVAPTRQVFLLTCHAAIADEVARALGAARIDL
jgi:uncharacterized protein YhaN